MDKRIKDFLTGQESVLRALEVAIAGGHSVCIITEDPERFEEVFRHYSEIKIAVVAPCPCGFLNYTSDLEMCTCSVEEVEQHQKHRWPQDFDVYIIANPGCVEDLLRTEKPSIQKEAEELLGVGFSKFSLTYTEGRKILQVAKTIAKLEGCNIIEAHHIAEALQYRREGV